MHYDRAYELLSQEIQDLHVDSACMYIGIEKAFVDDDKELQTRMLEQIERRIDGFEKDLINRVLNALSEVQDKDKVVRRTVDDIKELSDVLLSFVGRLINKQIGLVDAKRVYNKMIESEINFGSQQKAEDILDAIIEGTRK